MDLIFASGFLMIMSIHVHSFIELIINVDRSHMLSGLSVEMYIHDHRDFILELIVI